LGDLTKLVYTSKQAIVSISLSKDYNKAKRQRTIYYKDGFF